MGIFSGDMYKCILGMDILDPLKAVINVSDRVLYLKDKQGTTCRFRVYPKEMVKTSTRIRDF